MAVSREIRERAQTLERIDTHSHVSFEHLPDLRDIVARFDSFTQKADMASSRNFARGCRALYGIDPGLFLQPDAPEELFEQAAHLRAQGVGPALERALNAEHISLQLAFSDLFPENNRCAATTARARVLAYIDDAVTGDDRAFLPHSPGIPGFVFYDALCGHFGPLGDLDEYLEALDARVDLWRRQGVVGMKTALAYSLGLAFSDPSREEARDAFARKRDMTLVDILTVKDYAFRRALLACGRNGFPIVLHTGFIGGQADLRQTDPMLLFPLIADDRYRDVTFVLLHGGNPYVGSTTYLARWFHNVAIDFTWMAWMTQGRFRMALTEWLEVVPHGRFCWGSDSHVPEDIVGIGQTTRDLIAEVLEDLIGRSLMDERTALDFLDLAYQQTPKRLFNL